MKQMGKQKKGVVMIQLEEILRIAGERKASDVHLTVGVSPKIRVNGHLTDADSSMEILTAEDTSRMAFQFINEKQKENLLEYGELDLSYEIPALGRYRVNIFRQKGVYAIVLRLVATQIPKPEELGVPQSVIDLYQLKRGLVLVTGPTGSGKSTTLAAIIDTINKNRDAHIITLEDPIEYMHFHDKSIVNQREVGQDTVSYANALRAALREDPDVILVGEMRDYETISVAVTAAETGHLVLSTLHTIGAASTIDRIIDVFPTHQQQQIRVQLAGTLEAVVSQQLMPTEDGNGRVAAFEVLHSTHAVRNLIREGKSHQLPSVMQTNRKMGMITMDDSIGQLYFENKITRDTAIEYAVDPDNMEIKLF